MNIFLIDALKDWITTQGKCEIILKDGSSKRYLQIIISTGKLRVSARVQHYISASKKLVESLDLLFYLLLHYRYRHERALFAALDPVVFMAPAMTCQESTQ